MVMKNTGLLGFQILVSMNIHIRGPSMPINAAETATALFQGILDGLEVVIVEL